MKIKWTIEKPQGNFRPILHYEFQLEGFEKKLAMPAVEVISTIPLIPDPRQRFCLPNTHERANDWRPTQYCTLSTPNFRQGTRQHRLILPYPKDTRFDYIEDSFKRLRTAFETEMQAAKNSEAIVLRQELCLTENTRQHLATDIAAHKILQLAGV